MIVYVNDIGVDLAAGMTVRHALIAALGTNINNLEELSVCDKWGNLVGLDGALSEGECLEVVLALTAGGKHG